MLFKKSKAMSVCMSVSVFVSAGVHSCIAMEQRFRVIEICRIYLTALKHRTVHNTSLYFKDAYVTTIATDTSRSPTK